MSITAWPRYTAIAIFTLIALIIVFTFRNYGISWDEELQHTYGVKLLAYYTSGFADRSAFDYGNLFLYGGFFDITAAILNIVSPFEAYETRHLLGGAFLLAGLVGGWNLARLLAGERAGLIALVCLATTPLLYGHGFINPKDSPLAWLAIWTTYFACRMLATPERPTWRDALGFGISLGLTVGTRVIGVAYLFYLLGVLALALGVCTLRGGEVLPRLKAWLPRLGAAGAVAFAVMALCWPWAVQGPLHLIAAFRSFTHFAFYPPVLWNGELIRADVMPWNYLPGLLLIQLPEYVLAGIACAFVFGIAALRRPPRVLLADPRTQQYLLVVGSFAAPFLGYLLMHPTVYNGIRHFLFIVPPLVILSAIGLDKLIGLAAAHARVGGAVLASFLALLVVRQSAIMARLHPYEYVSYNALVGGIAGATGRFELDYWGTSLKESARAFGAYLERHPFNGTARVFACGDATSIRSYLPAGSELVFNPAEADFYIGMTAVPCDGYNRPGRVVAETKRMGATIGYVRELSPGP
jgi:hypothetical protein